MDQFFRGLIAKSQSDIVVAEVVEESHDVYENILARERIHSWRQWNHIIPVLDFPEHWVVKIIPPFGGAIIRFVAAYRDNLEHPVSVYLDGYNELGIWSSKLTGDPNHDAYWEIYPDVNGDNARFAFEDILSLFEAIEKSLVVQNG